MRYGSSSTYCNGYLLTVFQAIVAALEPPTTKKPKSKSMSFQLSAQGRSFVDTQCREGQGLHIAVNTRRRRTYAHTYLSAFDHAEAGRTSIP